MTPPPRPISDAANEPTSGWSIVGMLVLGLVAVAVSVFLVVVHPVQLNDGRWRFLRVETTKSPTTGLHQRVGTDYFTDEVVQRDFDTDGDGDFDCREQRCLELGDAPDAYCVLRPQSAGWVRGREAACVELVRMPGEPEGTKAR